MEKELPPTCYHDNEDALAEYVKQNLKWDIHKIGGSWIAEDYENILMQREFSNLDKKT